MKKENRGNTLFGIMLILLVLYFCNGIIFTTSNLRIISYISISIYFALSSFFLVKWLFLKYKNDTLIMQFLFLLLTLIYMLFSDPKVSNWKYEIFSTADLFLGSLYVSISIFPFYYLSRNYNLNSNILKLYFLVMMILYVIYFYIAQKNISIRIGIEEGKVVNTAGFYIISIFPFASLFLKNKYLTIIITLFCLLMSMLSLKRGAFITMTASSFVMIYHLMKQSQKSISFKNLLFVASGIFFFIYYVSHSDLNYDYLLSRLTAMLDGNTSGRDWIFTKIWDRWYESNNIFNLLFGYGLGESLRVTGSLAHNDWLEILISMGLLGLGIYIMFFYFIFQYINLYVKNIIHRCALLLCVTTWLLISPTMWAYSATTTVHMMILIGYVLGITDKNRKTVRKCNSKNELHYKTISSDIVNNKVVEL